MNKFQQKQSSSSSSSSSSVSGWSSGSFDSKSSSPAGSSPGSSPDSSPRLLNFRNSHRKTPRIIPLLEVEVLSKLDAEQVPVIEHDVDLFGDVFFSEDEGFEKLEKMCTANNFLFLKNEVALAVFRQACKHINADLLRIYQKEAFENMRNGFVYHLMEGEDNLCAIFPLIAEKNFKDSSATGSGKSTSNQLKLMLPINDIPVIHYDTFPNQANTIVATGDQDVSWAPKGRKIKNVSFADYIYYTNDATYYDFTNWLDSLPAGDQNVAMYRRGQKSNDEGTKKLVYSVKDKTGNKIRRVSELAVLSGFQSQPSQTAVNKLPKWPDEDTQQEVFQMIKVRLGEKYNNTNLGFITTCSFLIRSLIKFGQLQISVGGKRDVFFVDKGIFLKLFNNNLLVRILGDDFFLKTWTFPLPHGKKIACTCFYYFMTHIKYGENYVWDKDLFPRPNFDFPEDDAIIHYYNFQGKQISLKICNPLTHCVAGSKKKEVHSDKIVRPGKVVIDEDDNGTGKSGENTRCIDDFRKKILDSSVIVFGASGSSDMVTCSKKQRGNIYGTLCRPYGVTTGYTILHKYASMCRFVDVRFGKEATEDKLSGDKSRSQFELVYPLMCIASCCMHWICEYNNVNYEMRGLALLSRNEKQAQLTRLFMTMFLPSMLMAVGSQNEAIRIQTELKRIAEIKIENYDTLTDLEMCLWHMFSKQGKGIYNGFIDPDNGKYTKNEFSRPGDFYRLEFDYSVSGGNDESYGDEESQNIETVMNNGSIQLMIVCQKGLRGTDIPGLWNVLYVKEQKKKTIDDATVCYFSQLIGRALREKNIDELFASLFVKSPLREHYNQDKQQEIKQRMKTLLREIAPSNECRYPQVITPKIFVASRKGNNFTADLVCRLLSELQFSREMLVYSCPSRMRATRDYMKECTQCHTILPLGDPNTRARDQLCSAHKLKCRVLRAQNFPLLVMDSQPPQPPQAPLALSEEKEDQDQDQTQRIGLGDALENFQIQDIKHFTSNESRGRYYEEEDEETMSNSEEKETTPLIDLTSDDLQVRASSQKRKPEKVVDTVSPKKRTRYEDGESDDKNLGSDYDMQREENESDEDSDSDYKMKSKKSESDEDSDSDHDIENDTENEKRDDNEGEPPVANDNEGEPPMANDNEGEANEASQLSVKSSKKMTLDEWLVKHTDEVGDRIHNKTTKQYQYTNNWASRNLCITDKNGEHLNVKCDRCSQTCNGLEIFQDYKFMSRAVYNYTKNDVENEILREQLCIAVQNCKTYKIKKPDASSGEDSEYLLMCCESTGKKKVSTRRNRGFDFLFKIKENEYHALLSERDTEDPEESSDQESEASSDQESEALSNKKLFTPVQAMYFDGYDLVHKNNFSIESCELCNSLLQMKIERRNEQKTADPILVLCIPDPAAPTEKPAKFEFSVEFIYKEVENAVKCYQCDEVYELINMYYPSTRNGGEGSIGVKPQYWRIRDDDFNNFRKMYDKGRKNRALDYFRAKTSFFNGEKMKCNKCLSKKGEMGVNIIDTDQEFQIRSSVDNKGLIEFQKSLKKSSAPASAPAPAPASTPAPAPTSAPAPAKFVEKGLNYIRDLLKANGLTKPEELTKDHVQKSRKIDDFFLKHVKVLIMHEKWKQLVSKQDRVSIRKVYEQKPSDTRARSNFYFQVKLNGERITLGSSHEKKYTEAIRKLVGYLIGAQRNESN